MQLICKLFRNLDYADTVPINTSVIIIIIIVFIKYEIFFPDLELGFYMFNSENVDMNHTIKALDNYYIVLK